MTNQLAQAQAQRVIVKVNPFRCRVWDLHDRMDEYLTEESCAEEIESFKTHGQLVPALGRPLSGDCDHEVEIVYGARRLFIARNLGIPLQVELRPMSDREAVVAMDIENRHRKNTSPYERGVTYRRWLHVKCFGSQEEIARALNVSASQVSRLLKMAQLPSVVFNAFGTPLDVREAWGLELHKTWFNEDTRPLLIQRARALAAQTPRPNALDVYTQLVAPSGSMRRARRTRNDEVVLDGGGAPLFRIQRKRNVIALVIPRSATSEALLASLRTKISRVLQDEKP